MLLRCDVAVFLLQLCDSQSDDSSAARQLRNQWFGELLQASDNYLSDIILNEKPGINRALLSFVAFMIRFTVNAFLCVVNFVSLDWFLPTFATYLYFSFWFRC